MIITIFREEYLALIDSKHRYGRRYYTARSIQLFRWLSKDGSEAVQLTREEIRLKLLGERVLDGIATIKALADKAKREHQIGRNQLSIPRVES